MAVKTKSVQDQIHELMAEQRERMGAVKPYLIPINRTLYDERIQVYIRLSRRAFFDVDDAIIEGTTVEVGSVDVLPENRGKGYFRDLMLFLESLPFDLVYVENIHNPELAAMLEKHGYRQRSTQGMPDVCLFKKLGNLDA